MKTLSAPKRLSISRTRGYGVSSKKLTKYTPHPYLRRRLRARCGTSCTSSLLGLYSQEIFYGGKVPKLGSGRSLLPLPHPIAKGTHYELVDPTPQLGCPIQDLGKSSERTIPG
ncbi:hypothetical protein [Pasteuria penetrans]|uniref:hypothetical protein n=1 Tax=Pasteuria penetrans TaxID=86005 RepID=UPI0011EBEA5D|nr:hypothetical protein [Pasteuria penetrans]